MVVPVDDGGSDSGEPSEDAGPEAEDGGDDAGPINDGGVDADVPDGDVIDAGDPCEDYECGERSSCVANDDEASCKCDRGYDGPLCDTCGAGFVPSEDNCISICEAGACQGLFVERCDDTGETPACICFPGYTGPDCSDCLSGWETDGLMCFPPCLNQCPLREFCNDGLAPPACTCAEGYVRDGEACRWLGDGTNGIGITNGNLANTTGWTTRHVTFSSGKAVFANSGNGLSCEMGFIEQVFRMPSLEFSEPFAIEIDIDSPCTESDSDLCPPLLLELGSAVTRLAVSPGAGPQTLRSCVGPSSYAQNLPLRIRPGIVKGVRSPTPDVEVFNCSVDEWPSIDAVRIVPATPASCPVSESLTNPTFDSNTQWSLSDATINGGALTIQAGGQATTTLVVPSTPSTWMGAPTLRIAYAGSDSGSVRVVLDGLILSNTTWSAGGAGTRNICLPYWAVGAGHVLSLQATSVSTIAELVVDKDAGCTEAGSGDDGISGLWEFANGEFVYDAAAAHSGVYGLVTSAASGGIRILQRMPDLDSDVDAGLSYQFWYKRTASALLSTFELSPSVGEFSINSDSWQPRTDCLPRAWANQLMVLYFTTTLTGGPGDLHLDELGPVLSPSCD